MSSQENVVAIRERGHVIDVILQDEKGEHGRLKGKT